MSANDQPMLSAAVPRKPRRRWLRFSLRTLLILVTLLSIGLGWFVHRGERQRRAVAALKEMGGKVWYVRRTTRADHRSLDLSRWLPRDYLDDVHSVSLYDSKVTNECMVHLKVQSRLKWLLLARTQVSDADLAHIKHLTYLESLDLAETQVTDAGLVHLQGLARIQVLNLYGTQVTDVGLRQLHGLSNLRVLVLIRTQVTDAGAAKLQSRLPKCRIHHW